jgi:molecular chaperone HtpG
MKSRFEASAEDATLADYAHLLYGQALLAEGSPLPDPAGFAGMVADLMVRAG